MFQAVPPPIIRSSKLYTQHRVFAEVFLLLTAIVSESEHNQIENHYKIHKTKFRTKL